MCTFSKCGEV